MGARSMNMKQKIGFIGLGQMGRWMAGNLLNAGFSLTVFDIDEHARSTLTDLGATGANSPAELAGRSDVIFLSLPNAEIVQEVVYGSDGVAQKARSGQIVVDCGTTDYQWTIDFARRLGEIGLHFVDAPVTGMERRAKDASLTIMVGGRRKLLETIRPALEAMGSRIVHMGEEGSGQLAKLVNQLLFNTNIASLAEVLPMAVKLGLDPEKVERVINTGSGRSFASEFFAPNILENRFDQGYSLQNAYKDMAGALKISAANQIPLPMIQTAATTYQRALMEGLGDQDKGAMIKVFENLLGVTFREGESTRG